MVLVDSQNRFTVLLADEQDAWHSTVQTLLKPQGIQTLVVRTGREALEVIQSQPIHAVVLDQVMPGMPGLAVVKRIREMRQTLPAILLADTLSNNLLHEALGMHVFSVLSKPVDFNQLLDALARVMKRHYLGKWPD